MPDKARICLPLGDTASLRILQEGDVTDNYINTLNDPLVNQNMIVGHRQIETFETVRGYIEENYHNPDSFLFGAFVDDQLMGTSRLYDFSQDLPWMGILIFNGEWRGQGWGSRIVRAVSDYGLNEIGVFGVRAGIYQRNQASRQCFSKAGFVNKGIDDLYEGPTREIWVKDKD